MAHMAAEETLHNVLVGALACLVSSLVALETELGVTVKGVVLVGATEDAVKTNSGIGTLLCIVAKLLAITTFDGWVRLNVVPGDLILHFGKQVVFLTKHLVLILIVCLRGLDVGLFL